MLTIPQESLLDYSKASTYEYLETNGLGGWSAAAINGSLTRRYHGLLVAATVPPTERVNLVNKLDETVIVSGKRFELSSNLYNLQTIHPQGYQYLQSFTKELCPEWTYEVNGIVLRKRILMLQDENTVLISYEVVEATDKFEIEWQPFISGRGYHSLKRANDQINAHVHFDKGIFQCKPYDDCPDIFIEIPAGDYAHDPKWFYDFTYAVENYRGQDYTEDLFVPGSIKRVFSKGDHLIIAVSTASNPARDAVDRWAKEMARRKALVGGDFTGTTEQYLQLAADQFIVKRGIDLKTVIAGYPWFTDWGRDTMISLPGLTLSTGRFEEARKILKAFAANVSMGMLPNRFQDNNEPPEYNTVDGTLWYFIAIKQYLDSTGDSSFVLQELLPVLKDIIDWHFKGTRYNIKVDQDGLLFAGERGQQLTWMDARIGDWVVTPRMGKPVEIQALWYNALLFFSDLLELNRQPLDADRVRWSASKCKESFLAKFWYAEGGYLYDLIDESGNSDATIRPNQLLALSLPFPLIVGEEARSVWKIVEEKLYTPVGLRTLPATDANYRPTYGGDVYSRDSAYHQGTVWSWLLGPYIDSLFRAQGGSDNETIEKANAIIQAFTYHLREECIGAVSEIFDADPPHHPRGCFAQAWGVAEILRVIRTYHLQVK